MRNDFKHLPPPGFVLYTAGIELLRRRGADVNGDVCVQLFIHFGDEQVLAVHIVDTVLLPARSPRQEQCVTVKHKTNLLMQAVLQTSSSLHNRF